MHELWMSLLRTAAQQGIANRLLKHAMHVHACHGGSAGNMPLNYRSAAQQMLDPPVVSQILHACHTGAGKYAA
jgi:hypothetical protein